MSAIFKAIDDDLFASIILLINKTCIGSKELTQSKLSLVGNIEDFLARERERQSRKFSSTVSSRAIIENVEFDVFGTGCPDFYAPLVHKNLGWLAIDSNFSDSFKDHIIAVVSAGTEERVIAKNMITHAVEVSHMPTGTVDRNLALIRNRLML